MLSIEKCLKRKPSGSPVKNLEGCVAGSPGPISGSGDNTPKKRGEGRRELNPLQWVAMPVPQLTHPGRSANSLLQAETARCAALQNSELVTQSHNLGLHGSTGSKTGSYHSEKGDEKRAHRGSHHDLTNDRNPCIFRSDGVFGTHTRLITLVVRATPDATYTNSSGPLSCGTYSTFSGSLSAN
jgi:hypothetical protein